MKSAIPNYSRKTYGTYNENTGQFSDQVPIGFGPASGYIDDFPTQIIVPAQNNLIGLPGYRSDNEITITGIKFVGRITVPQYQILSKVKAYLFLDNNYQIRFENTDDLSPAQFLCPDEFVMLREETDLKQNMSAIKILASKTVTIKSYPSSTAANANPTFKDIRLWWKPKKPFKLKYTDDGGADLLNRNFGLCLKASGTLNAPQTSITFGGIFTTYYRDFS